MEEIIITTSATKQLSMIGKVNEPFTMNQICIKKGIKQEIREKFERYIKESNAKLIFITREYDGAERYWFCYKSIDNTKILVDENIIYL